MSTKIGHFEILSELSKSPTGGVYKVNDLESAQTVALKVIELSAFGDSAAALQEALLQESESTKSLSSPNITPVIGAGEIEGKFCATMEYVQGNSVATMLARKEGFSIWDLLDIGRQVCGGLEHAHSNQVYHFSLEPSKIMCGWDGTVKILGYGVSSVGNFTQQMPGVPSILRYMSPEQLRGEPIDARSNLFSLGAMFYEMVTDRKAFDREDAESLRQSILESTPTPPMHVNAKVHPLLSDLIMKALDKDPAQRYQRGKELLDDLEKCKESKPQAAKKPAEAPKPAVAVEKPKAPVASRPVVAAPAQPPAARPAAPAVARPSAPKVPVAKAPEKKISAPAPAPQKAAAAAAGWGGSEAASSSVPEVDASNQFITSCVKATIETAQPPSAYMSSAATEEPEVESFAADAPRIAVDPMMAEGGPSQGGGTSFSEISELPPLKEVYVAPPPPPPLPSSSTTKVAHMPTVYDGGLEREHEEKPKVQPREVAQKALKEIKGVPPQLMMYSIVGAVVLILVIGIGLWIHIHNLNSEVEGTPAPAPAAETPAESAPSQPAPRPAPVAEAAQPSAESAESEPPATQLNGRARAFKKKAPVAPVIVPGQIAVESTPLGAQVQVDGKTDATWVTPFAMTGLQPGRHSVTVSKTGYSTDTRTVDVGSGNKSSIVIHLAQLMATLAVASDPAGANVFVDGKDAGKVTPAQVSVDKGSHVILVRKLNYIDETTTAQFVLGQTVNWSPTLRPLGNVDSIKTVGKMKKLFGGNGGQPGQGTVSIRTQPKGAQIAVNQRMLDKGSPVDVMLDPGNYVIDINLSGYAPLHKVVTVDRSGKVVLDETLQRQ